MQFEIYQESPSTSLSGMGLLNAYTSDWRWRLRTNGRIIADGGEGYRNREDCMHGIHLVMGTNVNTPVIEVNEPAAAILSGMLGAV